MQMVLKSESDAQIVIKCKNLTQYLVWLAYTKVIMHIELSNDQFMLPLKV